jgi:flagellar M-ring protein FliF
MKKRAFLILAVALVINDFVVIIGSIKIYSILTSPNLVMVFDVPIEDKAALDGIVVRINREGIKTSVTPDGLILVADESTAKRMRAILIPEALFPTSNDPWEISERERWIINHFERHINLHRFQRNQTQVITSYIKPIEGIDDVKVNIYWDQEPVAVSVVITPNPESDITRNRKKIEGIQKLLKTAIEGLHDENIIILDNNAVLLNNFGNIAE